MSQEAAAGRLWSVAQATQLVVAMRKLLAQTLSGSTTSERRRDLFERGPDCLTAIRAERVVTPVVELTRADQEV